MKNYPLLKYWYKLFDKRAYLDLKNTIRTKASLKLFETKFAKEINLIQNKIKNQKSLTFFHSGHIGDIINTLPVIKELASTHTCDLYLNLNKPLKVKLHNFQHENIYLNKRIYDMLYPLLKNQKYINKIDIHSDQSIDINFDLIRQLPINLLFDNLRYGFQITGVQPDINKSYLEIEPHKIIKEKIVILRSLRYQNQFISYKFLENFNNILFVGKKDEYNELKKEIQNLEYYNCKDFLEMAQIIKAGRIFIGNSSVGMTLAEAMKIPRLLEACPGFPAAQVHGLNAHDFYFQSHFENFFKILYEKTK